MKRLLRVSKCRSQLEGEEEIVSLGPAVIPRLLEDLPNNPIYWIPALRQITQEIQSNQSNGVKLSQWQKLGLSTEVASTGVIMTGISYIITTFNRPTLLEKSVNSIIAERTFPSELIIVDDCSHTPLQLSNAIKNHFGADLHLIRNDRNLGVIGARNVGIQAAKYDFLLFLDDDDQSWPNRSQVLLSYMTDPEDSYAFVSGKSELRYPRSVE